jgi:hypothetical protein
MDNKRAAIVATAGVGLLVSALFLRKWTQNRRESYAEDVRAVVMTEDRNDQPNHNHVADPA